jgi:hypothetical protein
MLDDEEEDTTLVEPTSPPKRIPSPVKPAPVAKKKKTSAAATGGASVASVRTTRSSGSLRDDSSEQALHYSPLKTTDLPPASERTIAFSDLKLLRPGTQRDVQDVSSLSAPQIAALESWWKRESGPEGNGSYNDFKAWMWTGSQAKDKCLGCRMTSKTASKWNNGENFACRTCVNPANRRPCIRLHTDKINGVETRQLVVLPKSMEEPWSYWAQPQTSAPPARR